jgi:DNA-binding winged helix-turn-helix (wHTH) protein/dipeptidyl aminopeptidase/acylaminoacyl peptidase
MSATLMSLCRRPVCSSTFAGLELRQPYFLFATLSAGGLEKSLQGSQSLSNFFQRERGLPVYEFGGFRLDAKNRLLLSGSQPVPLTPKAFDLLLLLVKNSGRMLGKDELMESLWPGPHVAEGALTQNIYTLRKALGPEGHAGRYIETVPTKGYRFVCPVAQVNTPGQLSFKRLTFRAGSVNSARFTPDGRGVVYCAAWDGRPPEIFSVSRYGVESYACGLTDAHLFAVSDKGEMAISLKHRFLRGYTHSGTLARVWVDGGGPREVLDEVQWADWSAEGNELLVVREVGGRSRLEFPIGRVLYETDGWVSHPRVSPGGDAVAFINHPVSADDSGEVVVANRCGGAKTLSGGWISAQGLAWSAAGDEVWFTAARKGNARAVHAATLHGRERAVQREAGTLTLHDISRDGHVLLTRDDVRIKIIGLPPGESKERDLSHLDWSLARDLSPDGRLLLFTEAGDAGGESYGVYLRKTDGSPAVRLGDGSALALSPDGKWALAKSHGPPARLVLVPVGAGDARPLQSAAINYHQWACWFPDGRRVLFAGNEPGRGTRLYVQSVEGGKPRTVTPDVQGVHLTTPHAISPDGRRIAAVGPDHKIYLYAAQGGGRSEVASTSAGDMPVGWGADGSALYVRRRGEVPVRVYRLDLGTGGKELYRELSPPDMTGVSEILRVLLTPGGESYAYSYTRELSDLFLVEGLQ